MRRTIFMLAPTITFAAQSASASDMAPIGSLLFFFVGLPVAFVGFVIHLIAVIPFLEDSYFELNPERRPRGFVVASFSEVLAIIIWIVILISGPDAISGVVVSGAIGQVAAVLNSWLIYRFLARKV